MKTFPMFLKTDNRRIVIFGGGEQAAQKARLASKSDAQIVLIAPSLDHELTSLVREGRAVHSSAPLSRASFENAALTFVATGCPGADAGLHAVAKDFGATVNVVDQPSLCDVITPSIVDRDPVVIAIGTEGTAPVLGRAIKTKIETMLPPRIGALAALAGRLRGSVARHVEKSDRRAFWAWVFKGAPYVTHVQGAEDQAAIAIKAAIANGGAPDQDRTARLSFIRAIPDAADLMTLRAIERLQEADIVFCARDVDQGALELARRDAERVEVDLADNKTNWPRANVIRRIAADVAQNKKAVLIGDFDPNALCEEFQNATDQRLILEPVPAAMIARDVAPNNDTKAPLTAAL